ncbi:MAG: xylulokinase [Verrucomicrobiales bacterium]
MPKVLGFDSSTQSLSAMVLEVATGEVVAEESVNFGRDLPAYASPSGFLPGGEDGEVHADPLMWLEALDLLLGRMKSAGVDFSEVRALSGSGQQHGSVYLKGDFAEKLGQMELAEPLAKQLAPYLTRKTSPIWMDGSTSVQCREISEAVGGNAEVCRRTGSEMIERFTGSQIRRFWQVDEAAYAATGRIHLVSSFLASVLAGRDAGIDYGDGAGMNLMNLEAGAWDERMVAATAPDLAEKLPDLLASDTVIGRVSPYFVAKYGFAPECEVVAWTGDNPASLVGMGATEPGRVVISLGTSDTMFAAMPEPVTDPKGYGHVFGNPAGGFMSLICFKNGSLAREAVKERLGLDWADFDREGLARTKPGNGGKLMLPYVESEITPRVASEGPRYQPAQAEWSAAEEVRGVLEGQFLNMRLHSEWLGVAPEVILLTGGASRNDGIAQVVADVFGVPVARLDVAGSAGLGAAQRAAQAVGLASFAELAGRCSQPTAGSELSPSAGVGDVMDARLQDFREFLANEYDFA